MQLQQQQFFLQYRDQQLQIQKAQAEENAITGTQSSNPDPATQETFELGGLGLAFVEFSLNSRLIPSSI